jgi:phosphohistidine phosphatase
LAQWPQARSPVLVIGHQPTLGQVVAQVLGCTGHDFSVRKGSVWWLRSRHRMEEEQHLIHCVQSPDMLW